MFKRITAALALTALTTFAQAQDGHVFKLDQVAWQPAGLKGAEMAVLWGDEAKGTAVWAFRLQPGVAIPPHLHTKDYWGFAIQGQWAHIDEHGHTVVTGQDAYVRIRANELHADRCVGPQACINIIQFGGGRDIVFPEAPKKAP